MSRPERTPRPQRARGEWLYRALLRMYPPRFRRRYAADMLAFYRERMETGGATAHGRAAVWAQLIPDLLSTALAEWCSPLDRNVERAPNVISVYSNRREDGMSILTQDFRYAFRSMARRPGFTGVVLATLALGIGANAAIFTVVNAVLLRPLPYAHQERIVNVSNGLPYGNVSEPEFVDYQREVTVHSTKSRRTMATTSRSPSAATNQRERSRRACRATSSPYSVWRRKSAACLAVTSFRRSRGRALP